MLKTKEISIPFTSGVDTKIDEKISGKPLEIINSFIEKDGVLRKKFGSTSLPIDIENGGTLTDIVDIFEFENDLLISTAKGFYSFIVENSNWRHISFGLLSTVDNQKVSTAIGFGTVSQEYDSGYVENDKFFIVSKVDQFGAIVESRAKDSKTSLFPRVPMIGAKLVKNGNSIGVIGVLAPPADPEELVWIKLNSTGGFDIPVVVDTIVLKGNGIGFSTNAPLSTFSVADGLYIVFERRTGGNQFITKIDDAGLIIHQVQSSFTAFSSTIANDFTYSSIVVKETGVDIFTSDATGTEIRREKRSFDLATLITTDIVTTGLAVGVNPIYSASSIDDITWLWVSLLPGLLITYKITDAFPFSEEKNKIGSQFTVYRIASYAFTIKEKSMMVIKIFSGQTSEKIERVFIIDTDFNIVATLSELNTKTATFPQDTLEPVYIESKEIKKTFIDNGIAVTLSTINLDKTSGKSIEFQGTKVIPSGFNYLYDGDNVFNLGFTHEPDIGVFTAGLGPITGTFLYKAVYKVIDSRGNVYRSGTSAKKEITLATESVFIHVSPLFLADFPAPIEGANTFIEVYRAEIAEGNYRLVTSQKVTSAAVSSDIIIFDDSVDISENELLYITGENISELENTTPPSFKDIIWHNGRVFGVSARTNELVYSKTYSGGTGLSFGFGATLTIEANQGRRSEEVKALASLDSKLIIFKPNSIMAIFGEGPDNAGNNSNFTEPELVTTDVGCFSPKSIVLVGDGVFFQSSKGIYLLARNLESVYQGAGIERFAEDNIVYSLFLEDRNQVRFITSEGRALVYNTFFKQWTWFDDLVGVIGACYYKGDFTYTDINAVILVEDETTFRKNGEKVERTYDTGWLKMSGIQNFQRVKKMVLEGEYFDDHNLEVKISYDYDDSTEETYVIAPQVGVRYQNSVHFKRQKSQSIRIKIKEVDTGATEEGFKITDLTIIAGVRKGINKLPKSRRN